MLIRFVWLAMALSMTAVPALAQQRPLVTEDPETVGADRVLLEGGMEFDKSQEGTTTVPFNFKIIANSMHGVYVTRVGWFRLNL